MEDKQIKKPEPLRGWDLPKPQETDEKHLEKPAERKDVGKGETK